MSTPGRAAGFDRAKRSVYTVYGVGLASDFPFTYHLDRTEGPVDLRFATVPTAPLAPGWNADHARVDTPPTGVSPEQGDALLVVDDCTVVRFDGVADFFVWNDRILCQLMDPDYAFAIELLLLGAVMTLWLELRGVPTLHASAVDLGGRVVGFLATSKAGKSTLAASFVQRGARLLGDDLLPLGMHGDDVVGLPSYPQMRLWPEQAERLLGTSTPWPRLHPRTTKLRVPVGEGGFGAFCPSAVPVAALYLPERDGSERVEIAPLGYAEALTELVRHSFLAGVLERRGLTTRRFAAFARLLRKVPVRRLRYPSGLEHLDAVQDAIAFDLARLDPPR